MRIATLKVMKDLPYVGWGWGTLIGKKSSNLIFFTFVLRSIVHLKKKIPRRSSLSLVVKNLVVKNLVVNSGLWGSALTPANDFLQGKPRGVT